MRSGGPKFVDFQKVVLRRRRGRDVLSTRGVGVYSKVTSGDWREASWNVTRDVAILSSGGSRLALLVSVLTTVKLLD
jgi:hypothetical protein